MSASDSREEPLPPAPADPGMVEVIVLSATARPRDARESIHSREAPPPPAPTDLGMVEATVLSAATRPEAVRDVSQRASAKALDGALMDRLSVSKANKTNIGLGLGLVIKRYPTISNGLQS